MSCSVIYYEVLVISPGYFIQPDIRKYWLQCTIMKKITYEVLRVAMDCHYNLFSNTTAKVFPKNKIKCLRSSSVILSFLLIIVSKQMSFINTVGCWKGQY